MSQRTLITELEGIETTVLMGWDRPLQYHFMVIEQGGNDPLYSNLDDDNSEDADLQYFLDKAKQFGVTIPDAMVERLKQDKENDTGNAVSYFDQQGQESTPGQRAQ
jgi:hypothetical protein